MRICTVLLAIFALLACADNRFEYVLPVNKPKLVMNFVSADNRPWSGTLTSSLPILELPSFTGVPGATIKIYEEGTLIETLTDALFDPSRRKEATTKTRPTPGKTYTIEASSQEHSTAFGSYVQPLPVPIEKFDIKTIGNDPAHHNWMAIQISVTFADPPGENFYGVEAFVSSDSTEVRGQYYTVFFEDPSYENKDPYASWAPRYFDDNYFDGQRVTMTFKVYASESQLSNGSRPQDRQDYHWVTLRNVSKSYYRYLQTIDLQYQSFGDPYAQPIKVETNVKNGFGVVGGYTMTVKGKPFMY